MNQVRCVLGRGFQVRIMICHLKCNGDHGRFLETENSNPTAGGNQACSASVDQLQDRSNPLDDVYPIRQVTITLRIWTLHVGGKCRGKEGVDMNYKSS